jgi:hypothetical protein
LGRGKLRTLPCWEFSGYARRIEGMTDSKNAREDGSMISNLMGMRLTAFLSLNFLLGSSIFWKDLTDPLASSHRSLLNVSPMNLIENSNQLLRGRDDFWSENNWDCGCAKHIATVNLCAQYSNSNFLMSPCLLASP